MTMWYVERKNCVIKVGQLTKCLTSRVWPREWEFQVSPFTVTWTMVSTAYLTASFAKRNGTRQPEREWRHFLYCHNGICVEIWLTYYMMTVNHTQIP